MLYLVLIIATWAAVSAIVCGCVCMASGRFTQSQQVDEFSSMAVDELQTLVWHRIPGS
jgi:hypothetical protein